MVNIDIDGFANKIIEYHEDQDRPEGWFHPVVSLEPNDTSVQSHLCIPHEVQRALDDGTPYTRLEAYGISFGYTTELMMKLLDRAYDNLQDNSDIDDYAKYIALAVQEFAKPFRDYASTMCYPHFLFHGLIKPTLEEVAAKIISNARIIHETQEEKDTIIMKHSRQLIDGGLQLSMHNGLTDDYFGIAYLLAKQNAFLLSSASEYISKASFFVDLTCDEIYVITIQAKRFGSYYPERNAEPAGKAKILESEREYGRIGNILGMGPRAFVLKKVMDFGRENGYKKIRVIKPEEHPMSIEKHNGFLGNYEPVIRKAGITEDNGCYLESRL